MPRMFTGVSTESRVLISLAALLVKVTASTDSGLACPVASNHAIRVVRTRVLPLPAPARISADACGRVTAASCSGLRFSRRGDAMGKRARANEPPSAGNERTRDVRSEEHTSELQSRFDLVCRLLLEKKKKKTY